MVLAYLGCAGKWPLNECFLQCYNRFSHAVTSNNDMQCLQQVSKYNSLWKIPPCGFWDCKNRPAPFLGHWQQDPLCRSL